MTADSTLVAIEGLSFCVALRAASVYISTGERTAKELSTVLQLNAQQFNLHNIKGVNDVLLAGITEVSAFDQYIGAFLAGGRSVWIFNFFKNFNFSVIIQRSADFIRKSNLIICGLSTKLKTLPLKGYFCDIFSDFGVL